MPGRGSNQDGCGHEKRCNIRRWKYTIMMTRHEHTPRGGGLARVAGQSCLAGPSVLRLHPSFGYGHAWCMVGSHADRVKLFSPAAAIFLSPSPPMLMPRVLLHIASAARGGLPASAGPSVHPRNKKIHWLKKNTHSTRFSGNVLSPS